MARDEERKVWYVDKKEEEERNRREGRNILINREGSINVSEKHYSNLFKWYGKWY